MLDGLTIEPRAVVHTSHPRWGYFVKRLVFAHIGRPTIKAIDAGERPVFGEFGADGDVYILRKDGSFLRRRQTLTAGA
jgi:hypothetical protein